jgi:hypothetical protein
MASWQTDSNGTELYTKSNPAYVLNVPLMNGIPKKISVDIDVEIEVIETTTEELMVPTEGMVWVLTRVDCTSSNCTISDIDLGEGALGLNVTDGDESIFFPDYFNQGITVFPNTTFTVSKKIVDGSEEAGTAKIDLYVIEYVLRDYMKIEPM